MHPHRSPRALVVFASFALLVVAVPARADTLAAPVHEAHVGLAPRTGPLLHAPTPGWAGEQLFGNGNDWEPDAAADPSGPYVYMLTTRYSGKGPLPCERCDLPAMALKISSDDGATFGPVQYMPVNTTGGQYDPQIETDAAGNVYAVWIDGNFKDVFSKSTDHGATWSAPKIITRGAGWADHPWLGVSPNGEHVYVGFNHASNWVAQSHDGGDTWLPPVQVSHTDRYFYDGGTVVQDDGNVAVSAASYKLHGGFHGPVNVVVTRSLDGGATFQTEIVDTVQEQPNCTNDGCPHDHFGGQMSLAGDANGTLLLVYDGATVPLDRQYIFVRTSTDLGQTWTDRNRVSIAGRDGYIASFPAVVGTGDGDFRVTWMDNRSGRNRWNTYFRRSTDGGFTWTPEIDIADATGGTGYMYQRGFKADYGDYQAITILENGRSFAVWGAGYSYNGPGGTWYNREI